MFIPLGFHKSSRVPTVWLGPLLIVAWVYLMMFGPYSHSVHILRIRNAFNADLELPKLRDDFFTEACLAEMALEKSECSNLSDLLPFPVGSKIDPRLQSKLSPGILEIINFSTQIEYGLQKEDPRFQRFKNLKSFESYSRIQSWVKVEGRAQRQQAWVLSNDNLNLRSLLASQFYHADWPHLVGNLIVFIFVASFVEACIGPLFAFVLMAAGAMLASVVQLRFMEDSATLVGASFMISTAIGLFYSFHRHKKMRVLFVSIPFAKVVVVSVSWVVLLQFVAADLIAVVGQSRSNVAHIGHLVGFVSGVFLGAIAAQSSVFEDPYLSADWDEKNITLTKGNGDHGKHRSAA